MSVSLGLAVGFVLTIAGWLGLFLTVIHSRHVISRLTTPSNGHDERQPADTPPNDNE
jgi:hypothetical protein